MMQPRWRRSSSAASPGRSVRVARKRWPSWSLKDSWAPGCGRSRRTITRSLRPRAEVERRGDLGHPRALAVGAVLAGRGAPGRFGRGEDRVAHTPVRSRPTRKRMSASARSSVNACVAPAESVRTTISASATTSPGNCSSASSATAMWSAAVWAAASLRAQQEPWQAGRPCLVIPRVRVQLAGRLLTARQG